MSVFLKCKVSNTTQSFEAMSSVDGPRIAVAFPKRTGADVSQTVVSRSYIPVTTDASAVGSPRIAVAFASRTGADASQTVKTIGYVQQSTTMRTTTTTCYNITSTVEGTVRPYAPEFRGVYDGMHTSSSSYYYPPASSSSLRYAVHKTTNTYYYPSPNHVINSTNIVPDYEEVTSNSTGMIVSATYQSKTMYLSSTAHIAFTNSESDLVPIVDQISSLYLAPFHYSITSRSDGQSAMSSNYRVLTFTSMICPDESNRSLSQFNYEAAGTYSSTTSSSYVGGRYFLFTEDINDVDDELVTKKIVAMNIELNASSSSYTTQQQASYSTYTCDANYTLYSAAFPSPRSSDSSAYYRTEVQVFSKSDYEYYDGTVTTSTTY